MFKSDFKKYLFLEMMIFLDLLAKKVFNDIFYLNFDIFGHMDQKRFIENNLKKRPFLRYVDICEYIKKKTTIFTIDLKKRPFLRYVHICEDMN